MVLEDDVDIEGVNRTVRICAGLVIKGMLVGPGAGWTVALNMYLLIGEMEGSGWLQHWHVETTKSSSSAGGWR
jgi:hypothetical protein